MPQINLTLEEHQSLTRLLSATLKNKLKFDDNSTSIFKDTLDVITNDEPTFMSMTDKCFHFNSVLYNKDNLEGSLVFVNAILIFD